VLALGPERSELHLEGPREARLGTAPVFSVTAPAGKHLLCWHVWGPDGVFLPEYADVVVAEGPPAPFVLPSALSDVAGEYRVRVSDVLSGAAAEARLRLE
jgi:hypothetical protein